MGALLSLCTVGQVSKDKIQFPHIYIYRSLSLSRVVSLIDSLFLSLSFTSWLVVALALRVAWPVLAVHHVEVQQQHVLCMP